MMCSRSVSFFLILVIFTPSSYGTSQVESFAKNADNLDKLTNLTIEFLKPYEYQLKKWLWETSGLDYPIPRPPQTKAEFIECDLCVQAIPILRKLLATGISDSLIIGLLSTACQALNLAPRPSICTPIITSYAVSVSYLFRNKPEMPDDNFCGVINPGCVETSDYITNWKIRLNNEKPIVKPLPEIPANSASTKILQFTDIHLDLNYTVGMNAVCGLPICCRPEDKVPENPADEAKPLGSYGCGLPVAGLTAILNEAKANHGDAKLIFLTGDYVHSGVWLYSQEENEPNIRKTTELLKETFKDSEAEIYPVVGNHEPSPVNMYPPESVWADFNLGWMYEAVAEQFLEIFPPSQLNLFKKYGYYTVVSKHDPKLRIVVLNTNICYLNNFWLAYDPVDTFGQLQWFADTMQLAEDLHQKVMIVGHIYPGSGSCFPSFSDWFNKIVNRYEGLIKGQWYGHSHQQNLQVTLDPETNRTISISFVGGSALPTDMNSAFHVYYADGERGIDSTWQILNQQTYILNLAKTVDENPIFDRVLDANIDYGVKSMVPDEIYGFINKMVCDDALFLKYQKVIVKGEDSPIFNPCSVNDTTCKADKLSGLFSYNSADRSFREMFRNMTLAKDCSAKEDENSLGVSINKFNLYIFIQVFVITFFR